MVVGLTVDKRQLWYVPTPLPVRLEPGSDACLRVWIRHRTDNLRGSRPWTMGWARSLPSLRRRSASGSTPMVLKRTTVAWTSVLVLLTLAGGAAALTISPRPHVNHAVSLPYHRVVTAAAGASRGIESPGQRRAGHQSIQRAAGRC